MMTTRTENFLFGFLGAITAVVIGIAVFGDFQMPLDRSPASQEPEVSIPYLID